KRAPAGSGGPPDTPACGPPRLSWGCIISTTPANASKIFPNLPDAQKGSAGGTGGPGCNGGRADYTHTSPARERRDPSCLRRRRVSPEEDAMLEFQGKKGVQLCDGLTRRDFLRVGALGAGAVGLSLADLGVLEAAGPPRDVNCVLLFLVGG